MIKQRVLLLDGSYQVVGIISWQRAMYLMLSDKAQVVEAYEDVQVRSPSVSYNLPKVLRLFVVSRKAKRVNFSRLNVFARDKFTCGYCTKVFHPKDLTMDHVIPASRGGKKSWTNIVAACHACNCKKAGRTPEEARMHLIHKPMEPRWSPELIIRLHKEDPVVEWAPFIGVKISYEH